MSRSGERRRSSSGGRDRPEAVLAAWTALEALAPVTYRRPEDLAPGGRRYVADLSKGRVPWERLERTRPKYQLYYLVILGAIRVDRATDALVEAFGEDEERPRREDEKAAIAAVLLDQHGAVVDDDGVAVSSFAWALPLALELQLSRLGEWSKVEPELVEELASRIQRFDGTGKPRPLDLETIRETSGWLVGKLGLADALVEAPWFAVRLAQHVKASGPPALPLLNSFFLTDLSRASRLVEKGTAGPALRQYLGIDRPRDPADLLTDRRSLEAAVAPAAMPAARWPTPGGHALAMLQQAAVNLSRAELGDAGGILAVNGPPGTGKTTLLRDIIAACVVDRAAAMTAFEDPDRAFEASGHEVPAGERGSFQLYRLAASLRGHEVVVASSNNKAVENISKELPAAGEVDPTIEGLGYFQAISEALAGGESSGDGADRVARTWGLITAVLGNSANRGAFQQAFWWDDERSLRVHLKAARDAGRAGRDRWRRACRAFLDLERDIAGELAELEATRQLCLDLAGVREAFDAAAARCPKERPGWLARLVRTRAGRLWATTRRRERERDRLQASVDAARRASEAGDRLVDAELLDGDHAVWNLCCPWLPPGLHRKRAELFAAALRVHEAFIDVAARRILHNLSAFMDVLSSGSAPDEARRQMLPDLWSTLFLVVPVVSTTFASVERMLGELGASTLGWLLIDEAGQAVPQAAVGAILRARRAVVVGDPLQIPPVVTLPERLVTQVCAYFDIDPAVWAAPECSAQTLADRASPFQAAFRSDRGPRRVGVPLLVHRRCQEPMFGVANRIAYDGQMVFRPGNRDPGPVGAVLNGSRWIDITGEAASKWCPAEGDVVTAMLHELAAASIQDPDVFIISPFRIVAAEMRRRLDHEPALFTAFGVDRATWTETRIGTIHTFQGRQAGTVILLLGAPKPAQRGARIWAGDTPNILNVAVTRAKQNLYVVGSHEAWSGVGYFRELVSGRLGLSVERVALLRAGPITLLQSDS